jgi:hypothetical protein
MSIAERGFIAYSRTSVSEIRLGPFFEKTPEREFQLHCQGVNSSVPSLDVLARPARDIVHSRFSVAGEAPQRRLLAWRDRVGHMVDVLPSRADLERPFQAAIDRFQVGDLVMTDCRSDAMLLDRSLARISTDRVRDFVFQVFMEGSADNVRVRATSPAARDGSEARARILALDMNQPFRMQRQACRLISFFVPATLVQEVFPDPDHRLDERTGSRRGDPRGRKADGCRLRTPGALERRCARSGAGGHVRPDPALYSGASDRR